jgi:hypothetical protein
MQGNPPLWAKSLDAIAISLGGVSSLVDLSVESLLRAAGFAVVPNYLKELCDALNGEARLNVIGAIMARSEIVRSLKIRRHFNSISASRDAHERGAPHVVFIVGLARSGTSMILRFLATHDNIYAPRTYEILMPESIGCDSAVDWTNSANLQDALWDILDPNFSKIHFNAGSLPAECLPIQSSSFASHHWTGCYRIPSYDSLLDQAQVKEAFVIHRKFSGELSRVRPGATLLFKSPSYVRQIGPLLQVYPDAKFIVVVRSLRDALASHRMLLQSIRSMRTSDASILNSSLEDAIAYFSKALLSLNNFIGDGRLNSSNFQVVKYNSFLSSPSLARRKILGALFPSNESVIEDVEDFGGETLARLEDGEVGMAPAVEPPHRLTRLFNDFLALSAEKDLIR